MMVRVAVVGKEETGEPTDAPSARAKQSRADSKPMGRAKRAGGGKGHPQQPGSRPRQAEWGGGMEVAEKPIPNTQPQAGRCWTGLQEGR